MIAVENSHLVDHVLDGVSVIHICPLLDVLFSPKDSWMKASYDETCERVIKWISENGAHYHAWSGPSYLGLAERNNAVEAAKRLGKSIVVIEALS
jgi:hypothetical protein